MSRSFHPISNLQTWGIAPILALTAIGVTALQFTLLPGLMGGAAGVGVFSGNTSLTQSLSELVLYSFLHGGVLHLIGNTLMLVYVGGMLEYVIGKKWMIGLFLGTTLLVYGAILLFSGSPVIGMSGYCLAVFTMYAEIERQRRNPEAKTAYIFIFLNIALGVMSGISLVGHLFGAIAGYIGAQLYQRK